LVAGEARGLKARVLELFAQKLQGDAMLKSQGDRCGERVHEPRDGGTFLGHADEELAGDAVLIEAHGDVAFMAGDGELVRDGRALAGQAMPQSTRWRALLLFAGDAHDAPDGVIDLRLHFPGPSAVEDAHHFEREGLLLRVEPREG